ncbi:Isoleucine--tRNA ligase, cytoplasmic, partial [Frankliniella fusca]
YRLNQDQEVFVVGAAETQGEVHLVFRVNAVVGKLFQQRPDDPAVKLHLDASFKTLPLIFQQLLVLAAAFRENVHAAYMVLMTRRKASDYTAVLELIAARHPDLRIQSFMMDFEAAMRRGVTSVWPEPPQHGCWSHYTRRIDLYTSRAPLRALKALEGPMQLFRMVGCLPLLPANLMRRGLEEVIRPQAESLEGLTQAQAQALGMRALLQHVRSYWLGRIGEDVLSVSGLQRRTNNDVESWNNYLTRTAQKTHLNMWEFIDTLRKVEGRDATDFMRAHTHGLQPRRDSSVSNRINDKAIRKATEKLAGSLKTSDDLCRFLSSMAHRATYLISANTSTVADEREEAERDPDDVAWETAMAQVEAEVQADEGGLVNHAVAGSVNADQQAAAAVHHDEHTAVREHHHQHDQHQAGAGGAHQDQLAAAAAPDHQQAAVGVGHHLPRGHVDHQRQAGAGGAHHDQLAAAAAPHHQQAAVGVGHHPPHGHVGHQHQAGAGAAHHDQLAAAAAPHHQQADVGVGQHHPNGHVDHQHQPTSHLPPPAFQR